MKSAAKSKRIPLDCRVNGLNFRHARLAPSPTDPAAFDVVIEHRLLGHFALHNEFALELPDGRDEWGGWRKVSLEEVKGALLQAVVRCQDGKASDGTRDVVDFTDWEPEASTPVKDGFIPRIPVEGDTNHIKRAEEALSLAGIRNKIVGGIGGHGRIWGHVTFAVVSTLEPRGHLLRAGFVQSPESDCVLIDSKNGWKIRLLAGRP